MLEQTRTFDAINSIETKNQHAVLEEKEKTDVDSNVCIRDAVTATRGRRNTPTNITITRSFFGGRQSREFGIGQGLYWQRRG